MKIKTITIQCEHGLHLRIASLVAKIVNRWGGAVHILRKERNNRALRVNARSVMEMMMLGAEEGTPLKVIAEGPDEGNVLQDVTSLLQTQAAN